MDVKKIIRIAKLTSIWFRRHSDEYSQHQVLSHLAARQFLELDSQPFVDIPQNTLFVPAQEENQALALQDE